MRLTLKVPTIILVGESGAGKSTIGPILADELDLPFFDLDRMFELEFRQRTHPHASTTYSRELATSEEREIVRFVSGRKAVVAIGANEITFSSLRRIQANDKIVVYLDVAPKTLERRRRNRPADTVTRRFWDFQSGEEQDIYRGVAHPSEINIRIKIRDEGPRAVVTKIVDALSDYTAEYDGQNINELKSAAEAGSKDAPKFKQIGGRVRYRQTHPPSDISERKDAVSVRAKRLGLLCKNLGNQQPDLKQCVDEYISSLRSLRSDRGAYRLFLAGIEVQQLLRIKLRSPQNDENNPALEPNMVHAIEALIIAHAGLITLFPDISNVSFEIDRYKESTESLDALRANILDPALDQLAKSEGIFDADTKAITTQVAALGSGASATTLEQTQQSASTKHAWLRGTISALAQIILKQTDGVPKATRDAFIKEGVAAAIRNRSALTDAIVDYFRVAAPALRQIAGTLRSAFGWLDALLSWLNFK